MPATTFISGPLALTKITHDAAGKATVTGAVGSTRFSVAMPAAALATFDSFARAMLAEGFHPRDWNLSTPSTWRQAVAFASQPGKVAGKLNSGTDSTTMKTAALTAKPAPAKPAPAKLSAAQQRSNERLARLRGTYGEADGQKLHRFGLNEPQAASLYGTRFFTRLAKHDPAAELSEFQSAALLGLPAAFFGLLGLKPDRETAPAVGRPEKFYKPGTVAKLAMLKSVENPELAERIGLGPTR